jgi:hypothetical protein
MEFMDVPRAGGFCLRRSAMTCTRPYTVPLVTTSLSGAAEETYCGIDQTTTRCEAVLDLVSGATFILGCYGGAETFSDLVVGRQFATSDPIRFRNLNARLTELRTRVFECANAITARRAW